MLARLTIFAVMACASALDLGLGAAVDKDLDVLAGVHVARGHIDPQVKADLLADVQADVQALDLKQGHLLDVKLGLVARNADLAGTVLSLVHGLTDKLEPLLSQVDDVLAGVEQTVTVVDADVNAVLAPLLQQICGLLSDCTEQVKTCNPASNRRRHHAEIANALFKRTSNDDVATEVAKAVNGIIAALNEVEDLTHKLDLPILSATLDQNCLNPTLHDLFATLAALLTGILTLLSDLLSPVLDSLHLDGIPIVGQLLDGLL